MTDQELLSFLSGRFDRLDQRTDRLDNKLDDLNVRVEHRLTKVETKAGRIGIGALVSLVLALTAIASLLLRL